MEKLKQVLPEEDGSFTDPGDEDCALLCSLDEEHALFQLSVGSIRYFEYDHLFIYG